jgi:hypothetical protein
LSFFEKPCFYRIGVSKFRPDLAIIQHFCGDRLDLPAGGVDRRLKEKPRLGTAISISLDSGDETEHRHGCFEGV